MAAKMLIPNTRLSSPLGLGGFSTMNIRRWLPITSIIGDSLDQLDVYRTRVTSDELSSSAGVEKEYGPHGPRGCSGDENEVVISFLPLADKRRI